MKPIIMTDASSDLPLGFIEENDIPHLGLIYNFKGKEYEDDFGKTLSYREFYDGLREGEMPSTSQINEFMFMEKFQELMQFNRPIIYIGMSSGLSGTVNSAKLAKDSILKENPNADITVIDTKCASLGQGLLVYYAVTMVENGCTKEEIISWVEDKMNYMNHWFAVEDLYHLKRGGRISSATALVGNILDINPIIYISNEGTLKNITNTRGRKKAIRLLADKFKENAATYNQRVAISHGDCLEDAILLKDILFKEFEIKDIIINEVGPGLGSHCGNGMLSLCFIGNTK